MHLNRSDAPPADSATRIRVDLRRFPWLRRLAADYAYDFARVAPFFSGNPADRDAWARAIARTQEHGRQRDAIAAVVAAQQQRRGSPAAARDAARRLADPRTVAIVTGQQAGLFGGPVFTLLKALTAIKLADQAARDHGAPTVAVFWVESEDHDWDEVRTCTVFDDQLATRQVALPPRPVADSTPVAGIALDPSIVEVINELERILPATEFRAPLLEQLREIYKPGVGMAEAFARWLDQVLGAHGLIVFDASDPAAKPLAREIFTRELSTAGQTAALAARAGANLTDRGYHAQARPAEEDLALFHLEGGRRPVHHQDGWFLVGDRRYDRAALVQQAADRPASFSPNVLLRPVVQDTLFPTVCYVPGPNELAYLGQLLGVYGHFGVPMPLMYPRATATILDAAAVRFLNRYGLPLEALQAQDDSMLNQLLASQIPEEIERAFDEVSRTIDAQLTRLAQSISALDPTLEGAASSTQGRMRHDLETLHGKMIQAAKRRDETLRRQFTRARALAFPGGHAQERSIGFIAFLNQYGGALIDRLIEELPLDLGLHWVITI